MEKEQGKLILDETTENEGKLIVDGADDGQGKLILGDDGEGKLINDDGEGKLVDDSEDDKVLSIDKYVSVYPLDYYEIGTAYVFPKLPFTGAETKFATNPHFEEASADIMKKFAKKFPKKKEYYARLDDGITQTIGVVIEKIPGEHIGKIKVLLANGTVVVYATDNKQGAFFDPQDPLKLPKGLTYADNK